MREMKDSGVEWIGSAINSTLSHGTIPYSLNNIRRRHNGKI